MTDPWFEILRPACRRASSGSPYPADVLLFYVARWAQKATGQPRPEERSLEAVDVQGAIERIARNLADDGETVEALVAGDRDRWTALRRVLLASAAPRAAEAAGDFADEALQRIAVVLLTGIPPSRAADQLSLGPEGPANEYVFQSPFEYWARAVVVHLIVDQHRREARDRHPPVPRSPRREPSVDAATLRAAHDALPGLIQAIRALPQVQRSVLVLSLCRADVDEDVRDRLHALAPDLFSSAEKPPASDQAIAERLGKTAQDVRSNRSVARRKLSRMDARWAVLLDALLPHRSTRPLASSSREAGGG